MLTTKNLRFLLLLPILACAEEPSDESPGTDDQSVELDAPELGAQARVGPFEVEPYSEATYCHLAPVGNAEDMPIIGLEHLGSAVSHHLTMYLLALSLEDDVEGDCDAVWEATSMALSSPVYAAQGSAFSADFPAGIAAALPAEAVVLLEYHAVNPGPDVVVAEAAINAYATDPADVQSYANGLSGSYKDIDIAPGESVTYEAPCTIDVDMNLFLFGSHFHRHGTRFEIWTLDAEGAEDELLYESTDWSSPELVIRSDDPLFLPSGSRMMYRCSYLNDTDQTVSYGQSADQEMCMMGAMYYPDQGFQMCEG